MPTNDEIKKQIELVNELNKSLNQQTNVYTKIEGESKETRRGIEETLQATKAMIDELQKTATSPAQKEQLKNLKELRDVLAESNKELVQQFTMYGRIKGTFAEQRQLSLDFVQTQAAVFNYSEKIAHEYRDIARDIGLTREQAHGVGVAFRAALPEVLAMGGEMGDITTLYEKFF